MQRHLLQADVGADETGKFLRRDLAKTLETGDFRIGAQLLDSLDTLFLAVAIAGDEVALGFWRLAVGLFGVFISKNLLILNLCALVTDAEQGGLEHVDMPFLDEFGEELQEEGDDEQTDVHAVDIGIGSHNHLIITQGVETLLDVEGSLQEIELLVLVDHLLGQAEAVQRFATQREHRLGVDVAALGDAAAGGVALGDEDARLFLMLVLHVGEMDAAVAQLTVVQIGLLGTLAGQLGDTGHRLALALAFLDLLFDDFCDIVVDVQVVVDLLLDEVAHIFINGLAIGSHERRTQLDLGLTLEDGFLDIDGNGGHDARTDVAVLVLAEELLDGLGNMLLEGTLMGTALRGMLAVDEGIVLLAILVGMGEGYLDVVALQMDNGVQGIVRHAVLQQVFQPVTRQDATTVIHDGQAGIQVGVVAQHVLDDVVLELVVLEQLGVGIGLEEDERAVLVLRILGGVADEFSAFEGGTAHLAVAIAGHLEVRAQRIDGLDTDTVQTNTFLEGLRVVLTTRVEHRHGLNHLALRNATAIVADSDAQVVLDVNLDAVAGMHLELVDGVVDDFLQQHINAVFGQRTVTQTTNVHTWSQANVLGTC